MRGRKREREREKERRRTEEKKRQNLKEKNMQESEATGSGLPKGYCANAGDGSGLLMSFFPAPYLSLLFLFPLSFL